MPNDPMQGISAVKALQIANNMGIPIYTINQSNIKLKLPQLQLDSGTIADVQNAVNAGMVAIVPQSDITFNSWIGSGYIIINPETGAGAYMISGGTNGAWAIANLAAGLITIFGTALISLSEWDSEAFYASLEWIKEGVVGLYEFFDELYDECVKVATDLMEFWLNFFSDPAVKEVLKFICDVVGSIIGSLLTQPTPLLVLIASLYPAAIVILIVLFIILNHPYLDCTSWHF